MIARFWRAVGKLNISKIIYQKSRDLFLFLKLAKHQGRQNFHIGFLKEGIDLKLYRLEDLSQFDERELQSKMVGAQRIAIDNTLYGKLEDKNKYFVIEELSNQEAGLDSYVKALTQAASKLNPREKRLVIETAFITDHGIPVTHEGREGILMHNRNSQHNPRICYPTHEKPKIDGTQTAQSLTEEIDMGTYEHLLDGFKLELEGKLSKLGYSTEFVDCEEEELGEDEDIKFFPKTLVTDRHAPLQGSILFHGSNFELDRATGTEYFGFKGVEDPIGMLTEKIYSELKGD